MRSMFLPLINLTFRNEKGITAAVIDGVSISLFRCRKPNTDASSRLPSPLSHVEIIPPVPCRSQIKRPVVSMARSGWHFAPDTGAKCHSDRRDTTAAGVTLQSLAYISGIQGAFMLGSVSLGQLCLPSLIPEVAEAIPVYID
jgi:hypothetical protein